MFFSMPNLFFKDSQKFMAAINSPPKLRPSQASARVQRLQPQWHVGSHGTPSAPWKSSCFVFFQDQGYAKMNLLPQWGLWRSNNKIEMLCYNYTFQWFVFWPIWVVHVGDLVQKNQWSLALNPDLSRHCRWRSKAAVLGFCQMATA